MCSHVIPFVDLLYHLLACAAMCCMCALCLQGMCLLHWACDRGHYNVLEVLLASNADINLQVCLIITKFYSV